MRRILRGRLRGFGPRFHVEDLHRPAGALLAAVLVIGTAWILSGAFWALFAPAAPAVTATPETAPGALAGEIAARHLFGEAGAAPLGATASNLSLRGILAGPDRASRVAIVAVEGRAPAAIAEGREIQPGIRLERVYAKSIEISRDGRRETLSLPSRNAKAAP